MTQPYDLQTKSRSLQSLFGWLFWFGCFLLFSEVMYVPLKGIVMTSAAGTAGTWESLGTLVERSLPSMGLLAALWSARAVFRGMANGDVLSPDSSAALGRVGNWLIASAVMGLIAGPFGNAFDLLGTAYLSTLIVLAAVGLAIRLLGRVHALAADIAADNRQIV